MKPIPVVFHIGPLQIHTYGIGLAIAFSFAFRYFEKRLEKAGEPHDWVGKAFIWIIVGAVIGARVVHVVANIAFYLKYPAQIPLIWHGGLSSFGGLAGAIPTAIYFKRRYAPSLSLAKAFDLVAPVLISAWALGRILGPQLMYQGGGRPTNAWYGMQYAGQVGYRIPVPVFQAIEDFIIFLIVLQIEKRLRARPVQPANGTLAFTALLLWSIPRFWDEYFWLAVPRVWDAVEVFSIILIAVSIIALVVINRPRSATPRRAPVGAAGDPGS